MSTTPQSPIRATDDHFPKPCVPCDDINCDNMQMRETVDRDCVDATASADGVSSLLQHQDSLPSGPDEASTTLRQDEIPHMALVSPTGSEPLSCVRVNAVPAHSGGDGSFPLLPDNRDRGHIDTGVFNHHHHVPMDGVVGDADADAADHRHDENSVDWFLGVVSAMDYRPQTDGNEATDGARDIVTGIGGGNTDDHDSTPHEPPPTTTDTATNPTLANDSTLTPTREVFEMVESIQRSFGTYQRLGRTLMNVLKKTQEGLFVARQQNIALRAQLDELRTDAIHGSNVERDLFVSRTSAYLETLWSQTSEVAAVKTFLKRPPTEQQTLLKALCGELDVTYALISSPKSDARDIPADREKVTQSALGVLGNIAATEAGNASVAEHNDGHIVRVLVGLLGHAAIGPSLKSRSFSPTAQQGIVKHGGLGVLFSLLKPADTTETAVAGGNGKKQKVERSPTQPHRLGDASRRMCISSLKRCLVRVGFRPLLAESKTTGTSRTMYEVMKSLLQDSDNAVKAVASEIYSGLLEARKAHGGTTTGEPGATTVQIQ